MRLCCAEIQWYGGMDDGLVDVRTMLDLLGLVSEIARWHEICNDKDAKDLTDTEILDIVLNKDWPSKLRNIHIQRIETHLSLS